LLEQVSTTQRCFNIISYSVDEEERRPFITNDQLSFVVEDVLLSHPGLDFFRDQSF
jgi:hypothetical protein